MPKWAPEMRVSGTVLYHEINAMIRLGQRTELEAYFRQFLSDLAPIACADLDAAKGRVIALVSILTASVLELGADPSVEKTIAQVAADVVKLQSGAELVQFTEDCLAQITVCTRPRATWFAEQVVEQAKAIVADEYMNPLTDESVAERVYLSRSHFRYLFREVTGKPFKRYLTEVRLRAARSLMEKSNLNVKEVCRLSGYADSSSFYRAYRALHGVPPTGHRTGLS